MKFEELLTGTRLELELLNGTGEKSGRTFVSQLLEPVRNNGMIISAPISEARLIYIPLDGRLHLTFFHKKYGLMGFTAKVEAREYRGNIAILKIRASTEFEKIQRRKHYRLDCILTSELKLVNVPEGSDPASSFKATVKNISGSGACIVTEQNIPEKTMVKLLINLSPTVEISVLCVILRNQKVEVKKGVSYELGLYFNEISPKDQDLLIKYIFEQQRKQLMKDVL